MLKKTIAFTLLTAALATAHAEGNSLVLTDTRQYQEFTASWTGLRGCFAQPGIREFEPGDCKITKAHQVNAGELLTLDLSTGICTRMTWRLLERGRRYPGISAPDPVVQETRASYYECQADAQPEKSPA
jgi:hypothetical protein